MFEEPLFQDNILQTMYKYFSHYLSYQNWAWQFFGAMFFLYIIYKLLMYKNTIAYAPFFPTEKYYFSWKRNSDKFGIIFLLLCLGIYGWYLFFQEQSFFINYDTMGPNTMRALQNGITPYWGNNGRFSPISFWDINILYAITHNFLLLNIYTVLQVILICFLLWKLLTFIPTYKRCICISIIIISPAFFWCNLVSYPERILIIFFLLSLICFKTYCTSPNKTSSLWWSIFWTNIAIYTKENTLLIYFGILIYSFAMNLWNEKITTKSFLHPIKSARQFPLEILIFFSMLIFSIFYLVNVSAITDSQYISIRHTPLINCLKNYIFEFCVLFLAITSYLAKKQKYFLLNSLLLGSVFSTLFIVFILKLSPITSQMELKTYYLILPYLTSIIIITTSIQNKKIYTLFILFVILSLSLKNHLIYQQEEGTSYRQTAEFLTSQSEPISIFISEYSEPYPWWVACSSTVYKYYWPTKNITFTTSAFNHATEDLLLLAFWHKDKETFHHIEYQKQPQPGDFYVIKKTDKYHEDLAVIKDIQHELVHQNKLFEVYKIK